MSYRIGSMCSGYGGLEMAVRAVLGGEVAWVADNDPGAAAILAHRFPSVPNLGDITKAAWASASPVNILTAGWPCPPVSQAGRHQGVHDERWLFDDICTALGRMVTCPELLVLENVPGLLSANGGDAMARVIHGLAALGYVGRYRLLRASSAGAPHRRDRVFILAWRPDRQSRAADSSSAGLAIRKEQHHGPELTPAVGGDRDGPAEDPDCATGSEWWFPAPGQAASRGTWANPGRSSGAPVAADTPDCGRDELHDGRKPGAHGTQPGSGGPGLAGDHRGSRLTTADPERHGREGCGAAAGPVQGRSAAPSIGCGPADGSVTPAEWGAYGPAIARWERTLGRMAPRPTEPGRTGERLSPRFVEWMQGLPEGWVTDVPGLSRNAQLKALGNGVVPQQAILALSLLLPAYLSERAA